MAGSTTVRAGLLAGLAAGLFLLAGFADPAVADPIRGAGSTFAAPIIQEWSRDYAAARTDGGDFTSPDWQVDYELVGSLAGVMRLDQFELDFAATDVPLTPAELARHGRQQFPIVMGGIAVAVHLDGVESGALRLNGAVLAEIYLGKIATWSDARIAALNPQVTLPDTAITVLHRQDGSGSTFAFTQFLAASSAEWKQQVGADTLVKWPVGQGAEGTSALLAGIAATKGSIGYADYGQSQRAKLRFAAIENRAGQFVTPEPAGVAAAATTTDWSAASGFSAHLGDGGGEGAYPLSIATFAVVPVAGRRPPGRSLPPRPRPVPGGLYPGRRRCAGARLRAAAAGAGRGDRSVLGHRSGRLAIADGTVGAG